MSNSKHKWPKEFLLQELEYQVSQTLKNNDYQCAVSITSIDSNMTATADLRGAEVSYGEKEMVLSAPNEITIVIPYAGILELSMYSGRHIKLTLKNRIFLSITAAAQRREA